MSSIVKVVNLGRMSWRKAYELQVAARDRIIAQLNESKASNSDEIDLSKLENKLLLAEHDPVYTVGVRREGYDKSFEDRLKSLGADFVYTDRGGLITFHGHGQLTAYPIVYLGCCMKRKSMRSYVYLLEETIVNVCKQILPQHLKISTIKEYPGVWIDEQRKISAIGVHGNRHVTTHGISINCDNDLSWFRQIIPCGIIGKDVTSITQELENRFTINDMIPIFLENFQDKFNCQLIE